MNKHSRQSSLRVPQHLAVIMDGNGRWAEQRHLPRIVGHRKGVEVVQSIVDECLALGMGYLTLFAFSSENWGRPSEEVDALMGLLGRFLQKEFSSLQERKVRLNAIGETDRLPEPTRKILTNIIQETEHNTGLVLTLALSYGARNELVRVARTLAEKAVAGEIRPAEIDDIVIAEALDTRGLPDPDLLIRTSGEMRISNFLLWQLAYAELYFTDVLWPDFNADLLHAALVEYSRRHRRFGLTSAQLKKLDAEHKEQGN